EDAGLVVARAAPVDLAVAHLGLERRAVPQLEGLGGLDVVVTVDDHRGQARVVVQAADDDGVPRGRQDAHVGDPGALHPRGGPPGGGRHVGPPLGVGADAGDAHEVHEVGDVALLAGGDVTQGLLQCCLQGVHATTY